ncbi:AcrR family transcriptional regulator [Faecalicoccus acidiformans]|uniref:AcrR family transcriptional regulator n=1 Tax=Faecalicoccus acidiformans TaxID=915173 RepID=A0A7W8D052_9FIRM|nr:TetR/AcrR family transcriptional regulator [Faecalicoccus acidiformans]MBB5184815.1 AcrR family transcriptional regulator [Faecalicoccus acidiformans]MDM8203239.1 TetR/AcrR family transcriptional regulator [Faecalicoccus acidiformans]
MIYNTVIKKEETAIDGNRTTLQRIHQAAKTEFLEKGYKDASLRNIVKTAGMTTGAFYGYYRSKEELFEALVGKHYDYILTCFKKAQQEFSKIPHEQQPEVMSDISGKCMFEMLHYAYRHLEECKLILCCSEGTKFSGLIDEMVEIEVEATHSYQKVLEELGRPSPKIDPVLEHILITGMFHTFFELVIHEMPLENAENYVKEMRIFYTAGWMKIMGQ